MAHTTSREIETPTAAAIFRPASRTGHTFKKLCDSSEITLGEFYSTPEFDALKQEIK